jgi:uncharacterized membrane protein YidH (DUF202 family)
MSSSKQSPITAFQGGIFIVILCIAIAFNGLWPLNNLKKVKEISTLNTSF